MTSSNCENVILLGGSGSIGRSLIPLLKKDFKNFLAIDIKNNNSNINNNEFIKHDLSRGFPLEALKFIERYAESGIGLVNCLGSISSNCFLSLKSNKENHHHQFNNQIDILKKEVNDNFLIPITLATQFANLVIYERGFASIINFSSVSSIGNAGQLGYSSSKSAIEIGTKVLSKEFGQLGVRANSIAPGFIESESMRKNMSEESIQNIIKKTSLKKLGNAYDLYHVIKMLINCEFINGQVIRVDGELSF